MSKCVNSATKIKTNRVLLLTKISRAVALLVRKYDFFRWMFTATCHIPLPRILHRNDRAFDICQNDQTRAVLRCIKSDCTSFEFDIKTWADPCWQMSHLHARSLAMTPSHHLAQSVSLLLAHAYCIKMIAPSIFVRMIKHPPGVVR